MNVDMDGFCWMDEGEEESGKRAVVILTEGGGEGGPSFFPAEIGSRSKFKWIFFFSFLRCVCVRVCLRSLACYTIDARRRKEAASKRNR